jgi:hypothetical protein
MEFVNIENGEWVMQYPLCNRYLPFSYFNFIYEKGGALVWLVSDEGW